MEKFDTIKIILKIGVLICSHNLLKLNNFYMGLEI